MTYDELTDQQKADLALADIWIRGALVSLINFTKDADVNLKLQYWHDNINPILAALDAGETIPVSSGHAGAKPLTATQLGAIRNWIAEINDDMQTSLSLVVKAVGVNAQ